MQGKIVQDENDFSLSNLIKQIDNSISVSKNSKSPMDRIAAMQDYRKTARLYNAIVESNGNLEGHFDLEFRG